MSQVYSARLVPVLLGSHSGNEESTGVLLWCLGIGTRVKLAS